MAKTTGRIIAYRHDPDGGIMTMTTLYFEDGSTVTVKGVLFVSLQAGTFEVKYNKNVEPNTLTSIKLVAG